MMATTIKMNAVGGWAQQALARLGDTLSKPPRLRVWCRSADEPLRLDSNDTHAGRPEPNQPVATHLLLTVHEACAVLRVSRWTLYRLIQNRELDTIKIGSRRCVPVASIHALIERLSDREVA